MIRVAKSPIWRRKKKGNYLPLRDLNRYATEDSSTHRIIEWMREVDRLADSLRDACYLGLKAVCVFALLFLVFFELFAHLEPFKGQPLTLICGLLFFSGALGILYIGRLRDVQITYLRTRCISESLRIQAFWDLFHIQETPEEHIPRRYYGRLKLVKEIWKTIQSDIADRPAPPMPQHSVAEEEWFKDQAEYFRKASASNHIQADFWRLTSQLCFGLGLVLVCCLIGLAHPQTDEHVREMFLTLAPSLIIIGAISEFYMERRGFEAYATRYKHCHDIYDPGHLMRFIGADPKSIVGNETERESSHGYQKMLAPARRWFVGIFSGGALFMVGTSIAAMLDVMDKDAVQICLAIGFSVLIVSVIVAGVIVNRVLKKIRRSKAKLEWGHDDTIEWTKAMKDIGIEALHENVDWFVASADREITLPKG